MESFRYSQDALAPSSAAAKRPLGMTRRGFMAGAGNALVAAGVAKVVFDNHHEVPVEEAPTSSVLPESLAAAPTPERTNTFFSSERFTEQTDAYTIQYAMEQAVLFVDASGRSLGTYPIEPINHISPGASYDAERQIVTEGFDSNWLDAAKTLVLKKYPPIDPETVALRTNWNELKQAVNDPDESMTYETVHSIIDIVRYFGDKEVRGGGGLSRFEYVRQAIEFQGNLAKAPHVTDEIRRLMPGLCALESKFNDDVISSAGARGIFQFMPGTWEKELDRPAFQDGVPVPLVEQVAAAGELFSKMYDRLRYWCYEGENYFGQNYLEEIKTLFASQEDFEKYFLVPGLLLAFNTGEQGAGEVVVAFARSAAFRGMKEAGTAGGYDVFQAMCDFGQSSELDQLADFKEEAPTYVQRMYALAELLSEDTNETRIAEL